MECHNKFMANHIPSKEDILEASKKVHTLIELNKYLGGKYTDNAVKKWCHKYEIYDEVKKNFIQRTYPVLQYDLDNNFIKEWKNADEVTNELGFSKCKIQACCRGSQKQSHGYIWKYKKYL